MKTTTIPMVNPVHFKFIQAIILMMCLVLQVICGEQEIRCIQREREALLQFKASLVEHNDMLSSWTTVDCCQWKGIHCSNLTGHILMLNLHGELHVDFAFDGTYEIGSLQRYISGEIHNSLMELQQLKYLNLSLNSFLASHIPEFLGSLRNLRYLDLSSCGFRGKIPTQFGSLSHLKYLNLAWNSLEGSIPSQLGNLYNLQHLNLSINSFEGNLQPQLGNLSKLQYLDLSYNSFEGNIPSQLGNLSNVQKLYLEFGGALKIDYGNQWLSNLISLTHLHLGSISNLNKWLSNLISLTHLHLGSISNLNSSHSWLQMIGKLPKLRELSLIDCSLSDHFIISSRPSIFNFSTSLSIIDLSGNAFTSSMIFQWVSNITSNLVELDLSGNLFEVSTSNHFGMVMNSLEHLDLSDNAFKGEVLKPLMNICTLHSLNMNTNKFGEDLPTILHNLSSGCVRYSLQELDLSYNHITGSLPDLSIFSSLKAFHLSGNQLSGKIPEGIRLPPQLELLSINSNFLEGGLPKSFGNTCILESLDLSNNKLSEELTVILNHLSGCSRSLQQLNLGWNKIIGTLPNLLSMFSSLRRLYLVGNKLNGTISEDVQFPTQLEELYLNSNSLKGVITDSHFANVSKLKSLELSDNSLTLAFTQNWVPPFQLRNIRLRSCKLGPTFPKWLQTQNGFVNIDISDGEISDIVPEGFWTKLALREWITMNISFNNLQGIIPNFPQKNPYYSLSLGANQFEGPIPPFLRGSMFLDLSKNKFSSSISFLCVGGTVETLYQLDLSHNQLFGQIPDCWIHFKSLVYLDLSHNKFSGQIPTSMGSLLDLQALLLRNNNLTYEIPFSLSNCTKLVMLDISENRLSGPIPAWIGSKLQELQILSLGSNHFYGSLPSQICYLKSIQLLDLSLNNLSGRIPKCINKFTSMAENTFDGLHLFTVNTSRLMGDQLYNLNAFLMWKGSEQMFKNNGLSLLKSIDLSSNHFSEEIPIEIEKLFELVSLNLSRNHLTGNIPSSIGKLTSLEFLDLSRNQLVGSIPLSLTEIDRLTMLDVSHNHLSGMIPTGTQLQSFNASSYEDNDLCGQPLKKLCTDGEPTQEPIDKLHEDNNLLFTREFYLSMTIGFVISFWGVFGSILIKRSWRHAYFKFLSNLADMIYVIVTVKVFKWRHRR